MPSPALDQSIVNPDLFDGVKDVVFVIVDALGYNQLNQYISSGAMPNIERFVSEARDGDGVFASLTTVFPSTTAAALTAIYTGAIPAKHGLSSFSAYIPELEDVTNLVFSYGFSDGRQINGFDPFLNQPALAQYLLDKGVQSTSITDKNFKGSLLSAVHHRGSGFSGYHFPSTIPTLAADALRPNEKNFMTIYWPGLDTCAHKYGPLSNETEDEAYNVDAVFARIVERVKAIKGGANDTLFVMTADHGQVFIDEEQSLNLNSYPDLLSKLRLPPAGERRSLYLYPKDGEEQAVREWAEERGATVFTRQDALFHGLFGNDRIDPNLAERLGELIVLPPETSQWVYAPPKAKGSLGFFKGAHGGLHEDEMLVPCLMWRG
ncbi:MAG TPA: alkaline phosphatase family protein [Lentibacillus sp.]|uniref:alkaline phosphatase family protein n=1 Tax=Lentibacillus sp. TaxID=1925746 RepID=UPI002B4B398C|nr:alkaline phosphatase family protein [Lentibacillus sp.]HLR61994.1 alkaline phosphatase family protein [Lentibacillus sp.]